LEFYFGYVGTSFSCVVIMSDRIIVNSKITKDRELLEEDYEKIEILVILLKSLITATTVLCAM